MSFVEKTIEPFQIFGIKTRTCNETEHELGPKGHIAELWQQFEHEQIIANISTRSKGVDVDFTNLYGLYNNYGLEQTNGQFDVMKTEYDLTAGLSTTNQSLLHNSTNVINGYMTPTIPGGLYLVFTTRRGPIPDVVIEKWGEIWQFFASPESKGYKRTFTGDFEKNSLIGWNPKDAEYEIHIAVEKVTE